MVKVFVYGTLRPDQPGYWWFVDHSPQIEFLGNSLAALSGYSLFESEGRPFISKNSDSVYGFLLIARAKDGITDENVIQQFDDYEGIDGSDDFSFYGGKNWMFLFLKKQCLHGAMCSRTRTTFKHAMVLITFLAARGESIRMSSFETIW